ncbi:hypothetical protein BJ912DRAFT_902550 [Pholiota molesta]|nr:hypothetical protein BJ912DRAFT_902550 [Pholiota molesta]
MSLSRILNDEPVPVHSRFAYFTHGSRVTKGRLYPELNILLQGSLILYANHAKPDLDLDWLVLIQNLNFPERPLPDTIRASIPKTLIEALREHAFNNMPLRLILLPQMELIGRNEYVNHIASRMSFLFQKYACYSILSHTWLPTGEIIYQDTLGKEWVNGKSGVNKLKGFCGVTHRDHGITLAWIDTLCINKDSSAELDEAIQSMYKWYENSSICITYLRETISLVGMKSDGWFKRGWTLQELIAPKNMQFYGRDWTRLTPSVWDNDKANPIIQEIIRSVTGIEAKELLSFDPLKGSGVLTRMRWAASRQTTRGEDRAYSLMGIFGVNFSISYGEGAERAFFRLIEAIISSRHTSHIIQVLHWAGAAISDRIHTSHLIPSKPECYVSENAEVNASPDIIPTLLEPMVLTHLGLRARLLLIHVHTVVVPLDNQHYHHAPFYVNFGVMWAVRKHRGTLYIPLHKRFPQYPTTDSLFQFYHPEIPTPCGSSFFLGIYTFKEDNDKGCIYLPLPSCAFLLGIPTPKSNFSLHDISSKHFEPTAKIDTRRIIQLGTKWFSGTHEPIDITAGFITIQKELLQGMGMKVVNAYL